jgi:hypothetical protein
MKLIIESTTKIVKLNGSVMPCDVSGRTPRSHKLKRSNLPYRRTRTARIKQLIYC